MIYTFIPYIPKEHEGDLAWAYNECMKQVPNDDDWACFIDHDAMFTTKDWYYQLADIIKEHPEYSCFTAMTNRVGATWQIPEGVDANSHDIRYHRAIGAEIQEKSYKVVLNVTKPPTIPLSGVLILYKKSVWKKVPFKRFAPNYFDGVDNKLHTTLQEKGHKVGLMCGVYLYHWYKAELQKPKEFDLKTSDYPESGKLIKEPEKPDITIRTAQFKIEQCKDDNFIIVGVTLPYTYNIDVRTCLWVEYQKRKVNMMALYEATRFAAYGRNNVIFKILQYLPGATHVFFIDNDVIPPTDAIERLLAHDKDIVAGVTPIFKEQAAWSVMKYDPNETIDNVFKPIPYLKLPDKLFRAHHFGGTTVLIKRQVLAKMQYPWYQDIFAPGALLLGQDLYFTAKAKRMGFELWCDPTIKCEHIRQADLKFAFDKCLNVNVDKEELCR